MGGFANRLQDVLAGIGTAFATPRLQQQLGPDWRGQLDQREFERQRARELAEQQNQTFQEQQDEATRKILTDAALAPRPQGNEFGPLPDTPPDLGSMIGRDVDAVRRARILGPIAGRVRSSRPMLEAQEALNRQALEGVRHEGRLGEIDARGAEAQEVARLKEELLSRRDLNPAQRAQMQARVDLWDRAEAGRNARASQYGGRGRPQLRSVWNQETGRNEYRWIEPGADTEGLEPGRPATMVQSQGMAQGVRENVARMEALAQDPEMATGPIAGRASQTWQRFAGPSGSGGEMDFLSNAVVDIVYVKSGKQINDTELATLDQMRPTRARGNLPEQIRLFKAYAKTLLQKYGAYEGEFEDAIQPQAPSRPDAPRRQPRTPASSRYQITVE